MKIHLMHGLLILTIIALVVGCNDDEGPTGPTEEGTFTLSITGDLDITVSGTAWFGSLQDPETGEQGFALWCARDPEDAEFGDNLWFVRVGATRPGTGTYTIGDVGDAEHGEVNPQHFYAVYVARDVVLMSVSGTISITESTNTRLSGSFTFSATGYSLTDFEHEHSVDIQGEFNAVGGNIVFPGF